MTRLQDNPYGRRTIWRGQLGPKLNEHYRKWTAERKIPWLATNFRAESLPFQDWQKFKEAFAPEVIAMAVEESTNPIETILDPFGGSGTTPLTSQFLGKKSITLEVNPYLADVIESKLTSYDIDRLSHEIDEFLREAKKSLQNQIGVPDTSRLPKTFVQADGLTRWLFRRDTMWFIQQLLDLSSHFTPATNRLIRTSIGGDLVAISNVYVSGKGRRYRSNWESREKSPAQAFSKIESSLMLAYNDIRVHRDRPERTYDLIRGDSRQAMKSVDKADLVVFSPPYPNSFDYTDIYNVELWVLGYLLDYEQNGNLRRKTLSSHVQIGRDYPPAPRDSRSLDECLSELRASRDTLWNKNIPEMIGGYFADMRGLLIESHRVLPDRGQCWLVVGDSRYGGVDISVAKILAELAESINFKVLKSSPIRNMRTAPQQGGQSELPESLVVLERMQ
jgi:DNA modification methylase